VAEALLTGSTLVGLSQGTSRALTLLANGQVSAWAPLPNDPVSIARSALTPPGSATDWAAQAAVTIGGRTVWALPGRLCPSDSDPHHCTINGGGYSTFAVCCTVDGRPVDLTSLQSSNVKGGTSHPALGVDAQGRLWLAWVDNLKGAGGIKLAQLDPTTLQPHGGAQFLTTLPGVVTGRIPPFGQAMLFLACADTCSVVFGSPYGAYRWDGSGQPTVLWKSDPLKGTGAQLLAAGPYRGGFALASYGRKAPGAPTDTLGLVRAGADGRNQRNVASLVTLDNIQRDPSHVASGNGVSSIVTPSGLVTFALYLSDDARPDILLASVLNG
jgi:hypothetical protein